MYLLQKRLNRYNKLEKKWIRIVCKKASKQVINKSTIFIMIGHKCLICYCFKRIIDSSRQFHKTVAIYVPLAFKIETEGIL